MKTNLLSYPRAGKWILKEKTRAAVPSRQICNDLEINGSYLTKIFRGGEYPG